MLIKDEKRWGFTDHKGNIVIDLVYEEVYAFEDGKARVKKDDRWGMIDLKGNVAVPFEYDAIGAFMPDVNLARVCRDGKFGAINKEFVLAINMEFGYIHTFAAGLASAYDVNLKKGGFINTKGETIIPFVFDARSPSVFEFLPGGGTITDVCYKGKYFWINSKGEGVLNTPPEYKEIIEIPNNQ